MQAAQFSRLGGPEVLEIVTLPDPHPGPGQVRIAVRAVGLSGTDVKLRSGSVDFGDPLPQMTGRDVAGVVDELGPGVTDVAVGDHVFGASDTGAAAEYALLTVRAPIPEPLGFVDAAVLPAAVETATRALDRLNVQSGRVLFVNGASGGVGSTLVQLAVARGLRVIGAASAANQNYLRLLGAEPVVYGEGMLEQVRLLLAGAPVAAVDVAGNGVLPELIGLTGDVTAVVTLADFAGAEEHGVHFSSGSEDGHAFRSLETIGELIESGQFWLSVDKVFRLNDISEAHRLSEGRGVKGRLALIVGKTN